MDIRIDISRLTIGDLERLDEAARGDISGLVEILDRVVEGGARHLPLTAMREIVVRLNDEITKLANPGN